MLRASHTGVFGADCKLQGPQDIRGVQRCIPCHCGITRQKVALNKCLTNIDVIREHIIFSSDIQKNVKVTIMWDGAKSIRVITLASVILEAHMLTLDNQAYL